MDKVIEAIKFMYKIHHGQFRKDNITPYAEHPMEVYNLLCDCHFTNLSYLEEMYIVALLHDALEENNKITYDMILDKFGIIVARNVKNLTYIQETNYFFDKTNYLYKTTHDYITLLVKISDRISNSMNFYSNKETKNYSYKYFRKADIIFSEFYNHYIKNNVNEENSIGYYNLFNKILDTEKILKKQ